MKEEKTHSVFGAIFAFETGKILFKFNNNKLEFQKHLFYPINLSFKILNTFYMVPN